MIWSVSTSPRSSTETLPWIRSIGSISPPVPDVDEVALDRRRGRHLRAHQMGPAALALTALEVAVRGRGAALALGEDVGVHAQAHRAAGAAPLEAGGAEDLVKPLLLRLCLYLLRARDHHRAQGVRGAAALDHRGGLAQVPDPRICAGPDEDAVERDFLH